MKKKPTYRCPKHQCDFELVRFYNGWPFTRCAQCVADAKESFRKAVAVHTRVRFGRACIVTPGTFGYAPD